MWIRIRITTPLSKGERRREQAAASSSFPQPVLHLLGLLTPAGGGKSSGRRGLQRRPSFPASSRGRWRWMGLELRRSVAERPGGDGDDTRKVHRGRPRGGRQRSLRLDGARTDTGRPATAEPWARLARGGSRLVAALARGGSRLTGSDGLRWISLDGCADSRRIWPGGLTADGSRSRLAGSELDSGSPGKGGRQPTRGRRKEVSVGLRQGERILVTREEKMVSSF
jgi:hypothetical protein